MTPCERFKDKIFDFVDQELDGSLKEDVEKHLESCHLCAKFYQRLHSLKQGLKNMKPVEAPDSFQVVLRERIRREIAHKKGFGLSPSPLRLWIPSIAIVSIILIAALVIFKPFSSSYMHDTVVEVGYSISDEGDYDRIQYVIDELGTQTSSSQNQFISSPISSIDSLLTPESVSSIADLYQPVRF